VIPATGTTFDVAGDGVVGVFYAFSSSTTLVFADTNDDGVYDNNDFTVRLNGRRNLIASDFGTPSS
jgi:hypothetical protein